MNTPAGQSETAARTRARECDVFCRYLVGRSATLFVAGKYAEAHSCDPRYCAASSFDSFLLGVASLSPQFAQWSDSYACVAARTSLLRRKLILLIAILESCSPEQGFDEQVQDTLAASVIVRIGWRGLLFVARFLLAALFFAPIHFGLSVSAARSGRS